MKSLEVLIYAKVGVEKKSIKELEENGITVIVAKSAVEASNLLILEPNLFIVDEESFKEDTKGFHMAAAAGGGVPIALLVRGGYLPELLHKAKELGVDSVIAHPLGHYDIRNVASQFKALKTSRAD